MFIKKRRDKIFFYGILFLLIATVLTVNKKNTRIFFLNYIESLMSYNLGFSSINNLIDDGKLSVDNKSVDVLNIGDRPFLGGVGFGTNPPQFENISAVQKVCEVGQLYEGDMEIFTKISCLLLLEFCLCSDHHKNSSSVKFSSRSYS